MVSFHKQTAPFLFGAGAVKELYDRLRMMGATKALICTDKGVVAAGVVDKVTTSLKENGFPFVIFDGCLPDAPESSFYGAADMARDEKVDVIIAVGGGSDIDASKAASVLIKNPQPLEVLMAFDGPPQIRRPDVGLILIPTTCGTGSEETAVAVLSDSSSSMKFGMFVSGADLSIVDPELTLALPPGLTAITGMDVVAHAIESYTTTSVKNPVSDQRGLCAMRLAAKWLPIAVKDGNNLEARTNMSLACTLAGMAFNDSMNNYAHGIAHAFGSKSHLPHGLGCALAEPAAMEVFAPEIPDLIRDIGIIFGAEIPENAQPQEIGKATADALRKLMKEIGIPNLESLGLSREDVLAHKDAVLVEFQVTLAPIRITPEIVETTLASMYDNYR